ncbi:YbjQ family protein [Enemella dayhoffiae]|uniref:YbjQ family protein n=1 Tax=Enemella dayhoffiae TaxID=2016507 RepID=UPI001E4FCE39|nr:YbjQ family protein [Enemella dayhoffiae]
MIIVTSNGIPGYRIEAVLGEVMGMTVRSAHIGSNITASFRSLGGGEMPEFTKIVYESRNEVMNRMWQECVQRGGNAIVAMRFDTGSISQTFTEVCAYGTAVVAVPLGEGEPGATPQSIARAAAAQPGPGNWPRMEHQAEPGEGSRPQAESQHRPQGDPESDQRRPQASPPGYSPQQHQADQQRRQEQRPQATQQGQGQQGQQGQRPQTPEQQRPGSEDSWLDLN